MAEDVQGKNVLTNFHGMDLTRDKLCSMVKKWQTLIEAHIDVKTTDSYLLRMFAIGFTKKKPYQSKKTCYAQHAQVLIPLSLSKFVSWLSHIAVVGIHHDIITHQHTYIYAMGYSFLFFFFFFFFDLGFTALSRIFHLYRADRSSKVGENRRTRRKTTWPSVSRTWLSHIWPERGSNHSNEKPNGLRVNSLIH